MRRIVARVMFSMALLAPMPSVAEDVFEALNAATIPIQSAAKEAYLGRRDPVVTASNGGAVIHHNGENRQVGTTPAAYHMMKSVGHGPRAIWATIRPALDGLDPAGSWRARLIALRPPIEAVHAALPNAGLSVEATRRDLIITATCLKLIDGYLANGLPTAEQFQTAMRALTPVLLGDATEAARLQIDAMDRDVRPWWNGLTDAERARTMVVVRGSHPARDGNVVYSYFLNLLGAGEAGRRVIYAEGVFDDDRARGVLAAILADRHLAVDVFGDPMRMDRDLMGDGAKARLLELFGRLGTL